ncbi:hypothetical protein [Natrinema salsiterrestre]|uniref:Uncharacterized protein n=1 Tax=Natrinema salsiterrestre TaxID=2950540 RepID=A0A9Q4L1D4_9EURY|nr:hypothetical protein [Natrinema salsiterrestre]MDF9745048.1 hypothetical protein [Natrinema salsiterrestre]
MTDSLLHALSVPFAIVTGTGAGLLAVLLWEILSASPFGRVIALVSLLMATITIYHVVLLAVGPDRLLLEVLRSGAYTLVAVLVLTAIRSHQTVQQEHPPE